MSEKIEYPYLPEDRSIDYVYKGNIFMFFASILARQHSLDKTILVAAVIVKDYQVIGWGANGSDYHTNNQCQRVVLGCKTGEGYELCEGCHPKNHSEAKAIKDVQSRGLLDARGADLYLWGHWWCCKSCCDAMIEAGIRDVYLLDRSYILFNKNHPDNIVERQFK